MTGRAVPEWIGATPDTPIPARVKLRIWERGGGKCYLTGRKIMPGEPFDYEHVKSLRNKGENRETNIRLALRDKHKEKTAAEQTAGAKADRTAKKHLGIWQTPHTGKLKGRGFKQSVGRRANYKDADQ